MSWEGRDAGDGLKAEPALQPRAGGSRDSPPPRGVQQSPRASQGVRVRAGQRIRAREGKGYHRSNHKGDYGHSGKGCWFPDYILLLGVVNHKALIPSSESEVWGQGLHDFTYWFYSQ